MIDDGTDLRSLDGSFDGSNDGKIEGLFHGVYWFPTMVECLGLMKA